MRPSKHKHKPKRKTCAIPPSRLRGLQEILPVRLSRKEALHQVAHLLLQNQRSHEEDERLLRLVGLFGFDAETLLEEGVDYEIIKGVAVRLGWL